VTKEKQSITMCLLTGLLLLSLDSNATHPENHCDIHDRLVALLAGHPHYERPALVLCDELPAQGHLLELFMNSGERNRHSYTLICTRKDEDVTCIVSAGLIKSKYIDSKACEILSHHR